MTTPTPQDMERARVILARTKDDGSTPVHIIAQAIADERERTLALVADAFVNRIAGGWPDDDENTPEGWEQWALMLHGEECADFLDGEEGRDHFLRLFAAIRSGGDHA